VVREDESILEELLQAAGRQSLQTTGTGGSEALSSAGPQGPIDESDLSLKSVIGKRIAQEEKRLISHVLGKTNWNRRKAAEILEISYRSLLYKIKDYGLNSAK
jgi:transcriptional regulator with PAS, ATPase and Fis domain